MTLFIWLFQNQNNRRELILKPLWTKEIKDWIECHVLLVKTEHRPYVFITLNSGKKVSVHTHSAKGYLKSVEEQSKKSKDGNSTKRSSNSKSSQKKSDLKKNTEKKEKATSEPNDSHKSSSKGSARKSGSLKLEREHAKGKSRIMGESKNQHSKKKEPNIKTQEISETSKNLKESAGRNEPGPITPSSRSESVQKEDTSKESEAQKRGNTTKMCTDKNGGITTKEPDKKGAATKSEMVKKATTTTNKLGRKDNNTGSAPKAKSKTAAGSQKKNIPSKKVVTKAKQHPEATANKMEQVKKTITKKSNLIQQKKSAISGTLQKTNTKNNTENEKENTTKEEKELKKGEMVTLDIKQDGKRDMLSFDGQPEAKKVRLDDSSVKRPENIMTTIKDGSDVEKINTKTEKETHITKKEDQKDGNDGKRREKTSRENTAESADKQKDEKDQAGPSRDRNRHSRNQSRHSNQRSHNSQDRSRHSRDRSKCSGDRTRYSKDTSRNRSRSSQRSREHHSKLDRRSTDLHSQTSHSDEEEIDISQFLPEGFIVLDEEDDVETTTMEVTLEKSEDKEVRTVVQHTVNSSQSITKAEKGIKDLLKSEFGELTQEELSVKMEQTDVGLLEREGISMKVDETNQTKHKKETDKGAGVSVVTDATKHFIDEGDPRNKTESARKISTVGYDKDAKVAHFAEEDVKENESEVAETEEIEEGDCEMTEIGNGTEAVEVEESEGDCNEETCEETLEQGDNTETTEFKAVVEKDDDSEVTEVEEIVEEGSEGCDEGGDEGDDIKVVEQIVEEVEENNGDRPNSDEVTEIVEEYFMEEVEEEIGEDDECDDSEKTEQEILDTNSVQEVNEAEVAGGEGPVGKSSCQEALENEVTRASTTIGRVDETEAELDGVSLQDGNEEAKAVTETEKVFVPEKASEQDEEDVDFDDFDIEDLEEVDAWVDEDEQ